MRDRFTEAVMPVLGLQDAQKDSTRARLERCIEEVGRCCRPLKVGLKLHLQVFVTRNWWSHGSGHVAVPECTRVMKSLVDILTIVRPIADTEAAIASVQRHISFIESSLSSECAELSVPFHSSLIFIRALDQLRIAACGSSTLKDKNNEKFSRDSDVAEIIQAMKSTAGNLSFLCELVQKGRNYMFHGADTHRTLSLLLCTCAVAQLLRLLVKDMPLTSSASTPVSDTASGSDSSPTFVTPKAPTTPSVRSASSFTCEPADACEASAMQLMDRMRIFDSSLLLQEIVKSHSEM
jgi:hypothetical protein